ncbi:ABC transporter permease subunit [Clostridium aestuarii]|uniref:ABC transporter permease subunit n=1 Tax=Clostridium aestuarii TaxID=338193 RepID=A0ABT4CYW0_9CLOT|nr:ABC transporter permease subunit [Clostridium aestuarii]MCY6484169.1 ABC transporter permease subunit [Clostridium aestuarii]
MKISTTRVKKQTKKTKKIIKKFLILLFWLLIWELCSLFINNEILFPSPFSVFRTLCVLIGKRYFWQSVFRSILRVIVALILSIIIGIILGVISGINEFVEELLNPFIITIKATPVISIIIIVLVWVTSSNVAILASVFMCFPLIYTNVLEGIKSVNKNLIQMAHIYKVKRKYILKDIYLPSIKPYIVSGILMCLGIGWKVCVASEVLSTPRYSIGLNLLNAKTILDTEELFAWTIVVVLLSFIFENMFKYYIKNKAKE